MSEKQARPSASKVSTHLEIQLYRAVDLLEVLPSSLRNTLSSSLSPRVSLCGKLPRVSSVQRPFFPLSSSALSPPSPCQLLDHVLYKQFSRVRCVICRAAGFRVSSMLSSHVSRMMPFIDALQCAVVQFHPLLRPSESRDDASFLALVYFQSFAPSSCLSALLISTRLSYLQNRIGLKMRSTRHGRVRSTRSGLRRTEPMLL